MTHKAGFVNIIGRPNAGKSTLMNILTESSLSIISPKAQTTRRRIAGVVSEKNYQLIFSDTPGILTPKYLLQKKMMAYVNAALEDADVILYIADITRPELYPGEKEIIEQINLQNLPVILLLNKIDLSTQEQVEKAIAAWKNTIRTKEIIPVSAKERFNTDKLIEHILRYVPEFPPYYPEDTLTDLPERFFVAEIIREKIFMNYQEEIPYSTDVIIERFDETRNDLIKIYASILVEKESQKGILIGTKGGQMKKVGTEARKDIEKFLQKRIYLELFVKVRKDWRKDEIALRGLGY